jgi:cyclic-di-GMP-binding protein
MPTFDVVSKVDKQEIDNAVNMAKREVTNRYDFKGTGADMVWTADTSTVLITADGEGRVEAALDVLHSKIVKRKISLKVLDAGPIKPSGKGGYRQEIMIKEGIAKELAREIVKEIKQMKLKVQGSIQGDQLRVTGKKRDELQKVIAELKANDYDTPLQFVNFRD